MERKYRFSVGIAAHSTVMVVSVQSRTKISLGGIVSLIKENN